jgi:hypothetical protein
MAVVLCKKCKDPVTFEHIAQTTLARRNFSLNLACDCRECNLNYKAENRRCAKDAPRKALWDKRTAEESVLWYKARKEVTVSQNACESRLKKRRVETATESRQLVGTEGRKRIHWKPWSVFCQEKMATGSTEAEALAAFQAAAMDPKSPTKIVSGLICIGQFVGLIEDVV